jgi:hypothetical protein
MIRPQKIKNFGFMYLILNNYAKIQKVGGHSKTDLSMDEDIQSIFQ